MERHRQLYSCASGAAMLGKGRAKDRMIASDEVVRLAASAIRKSIAELERALTRLQGLSSATERPVDCRAARIALRRAAAPAVEIGCIQKMVADKYSMSVADLKTRSRSVEVVFPRQLAMYLACIMTNLSTRDVGRAFGGQRQDAVTRARDKIKRMLDDPFLVEMVNGLTQRIRER